MLLNTVVLTDPFTQHDPNSSNDPGKKSVTASLHIWLKRNQYEMSTALEFKCMAEKDQVFSF